MVYSQDNLKKIILFIESDRNLKAQEHAAPAVIKNIEFRHNLAEIIATYFPVLLFAMAKQPACIVRFLFKAVKIYAGVHAAVHNRDFRHGAQIAVAYKYKHILGHKSARYKSLLFNGGAYII